MTMTEYRDGIQLLSESKSLEQWMTDVRLTT